MLDPIALSEVVADTNYRTTTADFDDHIRNLLDRSMAA